MCCLSLCQGVVCDGRLMSLSGGREESGHGENLYRKPAEREPSLNAKTTFKMEQW